MQIASATPTSFPDYPAWRARIDRWAEVWGTPGLADRIELSVSTRLRRSLGRCTPSRGQVRLAAFLVDAPSETFDEVLCHEAAHVATYELHPGRLRAHGPEWRALMRQAGYAPRATLPVAELGWMPAVAATPARKGARWLHRCPVCRASRLARRRVAQWLCARCVCAGLAGRLVVERVDFRARAERG